MVHPPGDTRLRSNFPRHNAARSRFCTIIQTLLMRIFQQKQSFQNSPDYMFRIRQNYNFLIPRFQRVIPWLFLAWASVELACRVFSCNPAAGDVKALLDEQAWLTDESGLETSTTFVNSHYKRLLQRYLVLHVLRCLEPFNLKLTVLRGGVFSTSAVGRKDTEDKDFSSEKMCPSG